jgi:hypothetical protein
MPLHELEVLSSLMCCLIFRRQREMPVADLRLTWPVTSRAIVLEAPLTCQFIRRWVLLTMSLYVDTFGMNKTYIARSGM